MSLFPGTPTVVVWLVRDDLQHARGLARRRRVRQRAVCEALLGEGLDRAVVGAVEGRDGLHRVRSAEDRDADRAELADRQDAADAAADCATPLIVSPTSRGRLPAQPGTSEADADHARATARCRGRPPASSCWRSRPRSGRGRRGCSAGPGTMPCRTPVRRTDTMPPFDTIGSVTGRIVLSERPGTHRSGCAVRCPGAEADDIVFR